jgi:ureidoglycolate lyase
MEIFAGPLRGEDFEPFGDVLEAPKEIGRAYYNSGLGNGRSGAEPSLSVAHVQPLPTLPLAVTKMERHGFSSQSFIPLDVSRWLVIVAPKAFNGGPDLVRSRAFLAEGNQGITLRADTWHHPLTVLDRPARFAIFMWLDGSKTDEEFVTLDRPMTVTIPA